MRRPFTRSGISVGEFLDGAQYMQYALAVGPSVGSTVIQEAGAYASSQMSMQDEMVGNLTTIGASFLRESIDYLMMEQSRVHVFVSAHESSTILADSAGSWDGNLDAGSDPYQKLMLGIRPVLEETNLMCMGVLGAIGTALRRWSSEMSDSRRPSILIQIRSDVFFGDFG